ncbi:MAG: DUF512 domain-containing protein [Lachnospiraceae bacterium]|nr:DUF512 domain-containing protein [Lachnospiraceae bacterium]
MKRHLIVNVIKDSIAAEMGINPGDTLLEIDGNSPVDIFDYRFMIMNEYIELLVQKHTGEEWLMEIDKEENEDLGLEFENGLMDEYRSCENKCIFCFIDQMPPGLRDTLYFKDDDVRLSFLQGNYVTLTNMSDDDISRIIRYNLSPVNISIHTTDPELRCKMLNNRFAGKTIENIKRFYNAGIAMNGQIVLCKGINDGESLKRTINDLKVYLPYLESVSVVPVGLTKYRENLYPLEKFTPADAAVVLDLIHDFQKSIFAKHDTHFIYASDEWYMLAGRELPAADSYDGYPQLENGVGMMRLFADEFADALHKTCVADELFRKLRGKSAKPKSVSHISIAVGLLAYPYMKDMVERLTEKFPELSVNVYGLVNHFFGEDITVSGLLTGSDIIGQLKDKPLGERLLLPESMLRSGEDVFLDDITITDLEKTLQVRIDIVKSSGYDFVEMVLRETDKNILQGKASNE